MKSRCFRVTLRLIILCLISLSPALAANPTSTVKRTHYCGFTGHKHDTRRYARVQKKLDFGAPRTVRMIYFLSTDREFRADVVEQMKMEIRTVQKFFADQMKSHGYGEAAFQFETDAGGEPVVHRVDAQHTFARYDFGGDSDLFNELESRYNFDANIYLVVLGADSLVTAIGNSEIAANPKHGTCGF